MEISLIGHSCFKLKGKELTLVIDPYDPKSVGYKLPNLNADVVLTSHQHDDHNFAEGVGEHKLLIETPGEYELSDVFVYGFKTFHDKKKGEDRGSNTIFQIQMDGFSLLHLGDLGHELSQETLEKLTNVDVLMIPVGGTFTIDAKTAVKVISSVEPSIIIPMHYQTKDLKLSEKLQELKEFLDEMGVENGSIKESDSLKLSARGDIPEENEVYVLSPHH